MKRLLTLALFVAGFGTAGVLSGAVIADVTTATSTSATTATSTTSTSTAATTTTSPTTATTTTLTTSTLTTTTATGPPATIPPRVRVAGVRVGGLTPSGAVAAVHKAFIRPLAIVVDRTRFTLDPSAFASAYAATAVARARISQPGTNVRLVVAVRGGPLRAWVDKIGKRYARPAVDAKLTFRDARPLVSEDRPGRSLSTARLRSRVAAALRSNSRLAVRVHTRMLLPTVSATDFRAVIVIDRSRNRLYLYDGDKLERTFAVATGQAVYPTPRGTFHVVVKWKNPWWYPPVYDDWAKGLEPVPPGPNNPLGTRWMGLSAPGVGIHGTDAPSSIGYSASHGCIRMQVPDAEWLFEHVDIGTTVHIV